MPDHDFPPRLRELFQPQDERPMKLALVRLNELARSHQWTHDSLTGALRGIAPSRAIAVLQTYGSVLTANEVGEAPVHAAANLPDDDQALALLVALVHEQPGVVNTVTRHGLTPLDQALQRPTAVVAQWLLEHGASPVGVEPPPNPHLGRATAALRVPLITAVEHPDPAVADALVALLLAHGAVPHQEPANGGRALTTAVRRGLTAVAERLIAADPDWATPLPNGDSLLHVAASLPNGVYKVLLAAGADVNARDRSGRTPLHRAAAMNVSGSEQATRRNRGATTGSRQFDRSHGVERFREKEWLADASGHARLFIIQDLLAVGADVNAQDQAGHTALSRLVQHERSIDWHLVEHLVKVGADLDLQPKGFTAPLRERVLGGSAPAYILDLAHIVERHALDRAAQSSLDEPAPDRVRPRL